MKLRMPNLNHIIVSGRITSEPDLKFSASGTAYLRLSIAYNRNYKKGDKWVEEAHFFNVICFGQKAERVASNVNKGSAVIVEGSLNQDRWKDKNGNNRSSVSINAFKILALEKNEQVNEQENEQGKVDHNKELQNMGNDVEDDDLPF